MPAIARNLGRFLDRAEEVILVVLLSLIVAVTFMEVVVRGLKVTFPQIQEIVPTLFVWATWIGVSYGIRHKVHFQVVLLPAALGNRFSVPLRWLAAGVALCLFVIASFYGIRIVMVDVAKGHTVTSLRYPAALLDAALPAGAILATVRVVQSMFCAPGMQMAKDET